MICLLGPQTPIVGRLHPEDGADHAFSTSPRDIFSGRFLSRPAPHGGGSVLSLGDLSFPRWIRPLLGGSVLAPGTGRALGDRRFGRFPPRESGCVPGLDQLCLMAEQVIGLTRAQAVKVTTGPS